MSVAFYISGHGFGHASRQVEIVNAFARRRPESRIFLRTAAARWLLERTLRVPYELDDRPCDTGVVQIDSLHLDAGATMRRAAEFYATFDERAAADARLLRERGVRLVIVDAAPLGCEAAARAGVPSYVVSNFTWDWIYEGYAEHLHLGPDVVPTIQRAYAKARGAWRLPMHGGFETIPAVTDVPFVARHGDAGRARAEVLGRLGLPADRPVALVSFGGYGARDLPLDRLDCLDRWTVAFTSAPEERRTRGRLHVIADADVYEAGLRYEDLVRAVDAVVTKPGYGILSECIANRTALVYTSRGRFVEYDVLVREMPRYLRCAYLDHDALFGGRWGAALDAAVAAPAPPEAPPTNGAEVVADIMTACLRDASSSPAPPLS